MEVTFYGLVVSLHKQRPLIKISSDYDAWHFVSPSRLSTSEAASGWLIAKFRNNAFELCETAAQSFALKSNYHQ